MQGFLAAICRRAWCSRRVSVLGSRVLPGNVRDVRVHPKVHGAKTCTRGGCVSKFYTLSRGARLSVLSGAGSDVSTRSARIESSEHAWLAGMGKVPGAPRVRVCTRGCAGQARLDVEFDVEFFSAEKIWSVSQESYAFQSVVLATQKLLLAFGVLPALRNVLHRPEAFDIISSLGPTALRFQCQKNAKFQGSFSRKRECVVSLRCYQRSELPPSHYSARTTRAFVSIVHQS